MSLPSPPSPAPPPDEEQLATTSARTAFAVFTTLLGIALFLCVCTYLVHRTQPSPLKADGRSFRLTTRQRTPPAGSSSRSRTASLPAPASSPYASSPDGTPGSARKKRERRRLACLERARPWFATLHAWSAPAPGLRASVWRRPIDLLRLQPPRPRQPKHARACVRPPRRSVPRQADATSASRAKVDPVRVHLDSALQALDELAYDEQPAASKEARPFLPTLALASSPYAHPTLAATLTYGETPSPTKTARLLPHQPSPSLATSPSYQP